jgi:hypothetical protein
MTRRTGAPINSTARIVRDFAPDPVGTHLFLGLASVAQLGASAQDGVLYPGDKGEPSRTFNGDLGRPVQALMGAAALALHGSRRPVSETTGTIGGTVSVDALNDAGLRVFAARARRQSQGFAS